VKQKSEEEIAAQSTPEKAPFKKLVQSKLYEDKSEEGGF
jgi:hypothetical protein